MYFIVKNLRRQIEIPPDKFGRMINVLMPTVPPSLQISRATTFCSLCSHRTSAFVLQNVLATELQKAVEGQVCPLAISCILPHYFG